MRRTARKVAMAPIKSKGRPGNRTNRISKFAKTRVRDSSPIENEHLDIQPSESEASEDSSESESDPEDEPRAYNTLLGIFNINPERTEHRRKRRKLDRTKEVDSTISATDGDAEIEAEELLSESEQSKGDSPEAQEDDFEDEAGSEDEESNSDPFERHFTAPEGYDLEGRIKAVKDGGWFNSKRPIGSLGMCNLYSPKDKQDQLKGHKSGADLLAASGIKKRLHAAAERIVREIPEAENTLTPYILGYSDILFGGRTVQNASSLRSLTCLHALNHVYKTRDKLLKHNARLSDSQNAELVFRDQGFTRPKILFLVPTRNSCAKIVEKIVEICAPEQQENQKRFDDNFLKSEGEIPEDRPDDFKELFKGNDDDMFRVGIKFTRKTIKYFTQFYNSDVIIASPLGLRNAIDAADEKKRDFDYLSSIEMVIIDQTDAMLMQNWEHLTFVMSHLNLSPKEAHGCDFSRVRMWYLDDQAKYLRQTIVLSAFITPEINSVFNNHMSNVFGKLKYQPPSNGSMLTTGLSLKQTFSRFASPSIQTDMDARFKFFTSTIIPWILRAPRPPEGGPGILIFIPSYFDFVRIRNYFSTSPNVSSVSFGVITENKSPAEPETRRARSHFLNGKHSVLLYTGRAHHFYRYVIKGVKSVVMYQLPDNPVFYKEIVAGFVGASVVAGRIAGEEGRVRVLFSKWDALRLERVVGTERVKSLLGAGDTFDFI